MLFSKQVQTIGTENAFKVGAHITAVEKTGKKVIKCNIGEPDFPTPVHIREEVKKHLDLDHTHYCDPQGIPPLREAIARHIAHTRNIEVTADRVVVFPGAKPPIGLSVQAYVNPGEEVIYPSPGFPIYESFAVYCGAKPVPLHLDEAKDFSFDGEDIERLITPKTKLIFLNFPSNPTGGVATKEQIERIAKVIQEKCSPDVRVYSDEVYEDIVFDGFAHYSIASVPGMEKRTIIATGASKSYSWTGGRLGWAVFPTVEEAQMFKTLNINYFSCVPPYSQYGAIAALESPESIKSIATMLSAFQERRDIVVAGLNAISGIHCCKPQGAFYVFPNIGGVCESLGAVAAYTALSTEKRVKTSPSTLFQMFLLYRYQVAVMDRKSFGLIGTEGKHFLRLSIATGTDDLKEAVKRIGLAAQDAKGFQEFLKEGPLY
ncbi:MAG: aminotransferase class I/II-fold pyridoxal phosphate-dependent enzyme [bacterium]|nr:aminotransferase class I/II-fold pyridoxal phosphate-dependent enzyme [bacterium]